MATRSTSTLFRFKVLLIALLLLPTVLSALYHLLGRPSAVSALYTMRQRELVPEPPPFSWNTWFSGSFQKGFAGAFDTTFGFRPFFVRMSNQLYFSFLHRSFMDQSSIIVGKEGQLYQTPYLLDYSFRRADDPAELEAFVALLEHAQHLLAKRGIPLVYMTTPSKAVWHWETLPDFYQIHYKPGPRMFDIARPLFRESSVPFVDAARLTGFTGKDDAVDPPFPRGGIHWTDTRAFDATRELVQTLNDSHGLKLPIPQAAQIEYLQSNAHGVDADLARLLFVLLPPVHYPFTKVHPAPGSGQPGRKAIYVGSSFSEPVADFLRQTSVFHEVDYYFYYRLEKNREPFDVSTIDWYGDILQADAIIVESNESALPGYHIIEFLRDLIDKIETENPTAIPDA